MNKISKTAFLYVGFVMTLHASLLVRSGSVHSPGFDEIGHFGAGLYHWEKSRFDSYRVNPPLVRLVATFPIATRLEEPVLPIVSSHRNEFHVGGLLLRTFGDDYRKLLTISRWACIPFSLLGAWICFLWARELYGNAAGLVAMTIWCFDPNIIAYGSMIIPDIGAASLGLLACYLFWKWLREPDWCGAILAGLALGLAESTKTTWILAYAMFPIMWGLVRFFRSDKTGSPRFEFLQLTAQLVLSLTIINGLYQFDGSFRQLGTFEFRSRALTDESETNRFRGTILAQIPVPFPEQYVIGIDDQKSDFEAKYSSYLRGEWRNRGWWYYYLYALVIKTPLGTLALFAFAAVLVGQRRGGNASLGWELLVFVPGIVIFAFVSSQTGFNHHFRYVAPALPFFFILASRAAIDWKVASRVRRVVVLMLLTASIASSLSIYPHSLSYFNELVGGPLHGHKHLVDSNIDWGQDLWLLKDWMEEHPGSRPMHLLPYTFVDPRELQLQTIPFPTADGEYDPQPGWYAISVNFLQWDDNPDGRSPWGVQVPKVGYFKRAEPHDRIGYSIYIYHLTESDANRLRRELELPLLEEERYQDE